MNLSLNRLRDLFQAGKGAIGTFVSMGNESLVECLGYTGLDFVINRKAKGALPDGRNFAMDSFSIDKEQIACYT